MARRIEDGWFDWTVRSIFDGHIFSVCENYATRLDRSSDRRLIPGPYDMRWATRSTSIRLKTFNHAWVSPVSQAYHDHWRPIAYCRQQKGYPFLFSLGGSRPHVTRKVSR
jgi:hypothetical protein